jgi:NAD+ diphosphatase
MIKRQHPDGLAGPHPFAIAHHLLGRWVHAGSNEGA